MAEIFTPRLDRGTLTSKLGELFGIDPHMIRDFHAESSSDNPGQASLTIEAKLTIPLDQFNAILNDAWVDHG